jgi:hypothetical protein
MVLLSGGAAGELTVHLTHSMPFFDHYETRENDGPWQSRAGEFAWKLSPGGNRLEARPVDRMQKSGIVSFVTVEYRP